MTRNRNSVAEIWTEGKTDWMLIKKAQEVLGIDLNISYNEYEDEDMGGETLLKRCESFSKKENLTPFIFIFDRDTKEILSSVTDGKKMFKNWGNNVFSFSIPIPEHRAGWTDICIEHYFTDDEIKTEIDGKRLFLSNEFDEKSGKFVKNPAISLGNKGKIKNCCGDTNYKIIDREVYDTNLENIALSKSRFSEHVRNLQNGNDKYDFSHFRDIFRVINSIIEVASPKVNLIFPSEEQMISSLDHSSDLEKAQKHLFMLEQVVRFIMQLFSIMVIKTYEDAINTQNGKFSEKVLQNASSVRKVLKGTFTNPALRTLYSLMKHCLYMASDSEKYELREFVSLLEAEFKLQELGMLIQNLETIFPDEKRRATYADKYNLKHSLSKYVLPKFIEFLSLDKSKQDDLLEEYLDENEIDFTVWTIGILKLVEVVKPLSLFRFRIRSFQYIDRQTNEHVIACKLYENYSMKFYEERIPLTEAKETERNLSEIFIADVPVGIFPFFVIKDDALYSYNKQSGSGYEYFSMNQNRQHIHYTKKSFNRLVFKSGSKQELFWVETPPTINPHNGIKANIPEAGSEYFVGRKAQIRDIKQKILQIPNNNGILYGPGGIGKTELLIQISEELYSAEKNQDIIFDNIIWISAKRDFYDHIHNKVEKRNPQFKTLEHTLVFILRFFDFEDAEEYDSDAAKNLVIDLLYNNKVLLILDNFETLTLTDQEKILVFFNETAKSQLRRKPQNFKLLISSREKVAGNFVPFQLNGLGLRETKMLSRKIYEKYADSGNPDLTEFQKDELYKKSFGIPIVIKHFYAQVFEYSKSFSETINALGKYETEIVQFSFKEILAQIEVRDSTQTQLKILLLLEIISYPLMIRQIADILSVDERKIAELMPVLQNYQCVKRLNEHNFEKYSINEEIRLMTAGLAQRYTDVVQSIRNNMIENFSVDKQLNYNQLELGIVKLFEQYVSQEEYLEAEDLIKKSIQDHVESFLLKYHYARYLINYRNKLEEAIQLLEDIREPSGNHPNILRLLFKSYIDLSEPDFESAHVYAQELERTDLLNDELLEELVEFYVRWSTSIKVMATEFDPIKEILRQGEYKRNAEKALDLLKRINNQSPNIYYLYAQSYFNLWKDDFAEQNIEKAIKLAQKDPNESAAQYEYFLGVIKKSKQKHNKKGSWSHN